MNKCKASAFKNLDLKKSNFLEKKMYPILDTRVECKDVLKPSVERLAALLECYQNGM